MRRVAVGGGIGVVLLMIVISALTGLDLSSVFPTDGGGGVPAPAPGPSAPAAGAAPQQVDPAQQRLADFVSVILASTEDTWPALLAQVGVRYDPPRLAFFSDSVDSACGYATAAVGPFYCPPDRRVYIDLSFFRDLDQRFGAPGDFAQAYVIAHEIGHHVQTLLGTSDRVAQQSRAGGRAGANALSVRQELQADCYAGVWAHHAQQRQRQLIEPGDVEEGLRAAAAIGDDRLQRQSRGYVAPESFTHGTSEQRVRWFRTGMSYGRIDLCDTFSAAQL